MTTPQYIPPEFQQHLALPTSNIDEPGAAKARMQLAKEKASGTRSQVNIDRANKQIKAYQAQLKNKKLSSRQRGQITAQLKAQQQLLAAQTKAHAASVQQQGKLQNTVYEKLGQYDKLLTGANRDAFSALKALFDGFGLGSLAPKIYDYVKQGYGSDTISLLLQDTKEYKTRFAGNEARVKAGLPVLSPAEYLATEQSYRQILSSAGLPVGFYDSPTDFTKWIAGDVSPTEVKDRVDQASQWVSQANPEVKQALKNMYGVDESHLVAYALDRSRAVPLLQKQARAAEIGAAALRRGFQLNRADFEDFAGLGITGQMAEQGFSQIADSYQTMQDIAARFGLTWNQQEAEQEVFTPGAVAAPGQTSAYEKGKRLRSQERALFQSQGGASVQGLNAGYSQT